MEDMQGKVAIVTGASRGIGRFIARHLARERMRLVLVARSARELDEAAAEVGDGALACPADVSSEGDLAAMLERVERQVGPPDVLINNAGIESASAFERMPPDAIRRVVEVNLVAPMVLTRLVLPGMLLRGRGHVVNVASMAGKQPPPFVATYASTKAGLIALTHSLRSELEGRGVGVSVVCPGFVTEAGMFADAQRAHGGRAPRLAGAVSPDEVAAAVVRAVRDDLPEVLVNPGPARLAGAILELFPAARAILNERLGVKKVFARHVRAREESTPER
jgi:short-subunit dehydrogenase